jgi:predicted glycogen debranching enzyme
MYNSVDASLLLFEQVNKYLEYTNDYDFVKEELYEKLKDIITNYSQGTDFENNNIYLDSDGLIVSGTPSTQNTWMDAKIGEYVVTPRNGKVVEINALWYNSLKTLENLAKKFGEDDVSVSCKEASRRCKLAFNKSFYNPRRKCLFDVLGDSKIRPNQLFALSTTYPIMNLSTENAKNVFNTVTDKLLTRYGLRTLSRIDEGYIATYEGDSFKRDMSYHQGVSWVWLLGLYADAFKNMIKAEKDQTEKKKLQDRYNIFKENVYTTFKKEINDEEAVQTISELYNSKAPYVPGGTYSQAWSVSEILKICTKK